ncbi:protein adenylyltransferase SelO [Pseudotabrizicola alkalilacus]|uniref:Protein nucleotidyltransferase YdiU n=1 Tax=Pseudotabrizicola alkalilacus TaxID=2305252 RepID=A0A411Z297_9RHOB|nr:YdiU family protein [Pseudotabrizicola alkalilacus]RGP37187.1 YdiU family protein [Pseudotabrizicola alkalilacus]
MTQGFQPSAALTGGFRFDNSWHRDLPGTYVEQAPDTAPAPQLLVLNHRLAAALGLEAEGLAQNPGWFAGGAVPEGAAPIALAYAGHQFGGFSPQLGDGRAHLIGEHIAPDGQRWDIQLKGSGRTPFSRGGDGKAALGPMLREYLISEAMAALGVPTTRSLAVALTGEDVRREAGRLPGAVVTRVAASHLRVGTLQFWAARGDHDALARVVDYAIARHDPDLVGQDGRQLAFFDRVTARQARLVAAWMGLGFVHGVLNTDNVALSGETIDYGPCAFMEAYAPGTVFSSIDHQGRYAYANQPHILAWNLAKLAESLLPLMGDAEAAVQVLNDRLSGVADLYQAEWLAVMRHKLALNGAQDGDADLAKGFLAAMEGQGADWTLAFRRLAEAETGDTTPLRALFADSTTLDLWLPLWRARLRPDATAHLRAVNPLVIPRNHMVEAALQAAEQGDLTPFTALLVQVTDPYTDQPGREAFALPAPSGFGDYVTFCGT